MAIMVVSIWNFAIWAAHTCISFLLTKIEFFLFIYKIAIGSLNKIEINI